MKHISLFSQNCGVGLIRPFRNSMSGRRYRVLRLDLGSIVCCVCVCEACAQETVGGRLRYCSHRNQADSFVGALRKTWNGDRAVVFSIARNAHNIFLQF